MHVPVPLLHAGVHEMHEADVTKRRCSRIDNPPRSYYADVIWPANTLPGPIPISTSSDCHSSSHRVSTFLFFSPWLIRSSLSSPSINTELISKLSVVLRNCSVLADVIFVTALSSSASAYSLAACKSACRSQLSESILISIHP